LSEEDKKPIWKKWWFWGIVIIIIYGIGLARGGKQAAQTTVPELQSGDKITTADSLKLALDRVLVKGANKDKIAVAYKIRDVKQMGDNEFNIIIYSALGDETNFSGNTYQILDYINTELISKTNVQFFEISVQYFKKINGESIRVCTYQIPKESIIAILEYGSKEGSPLTGLKKMDGVTKESKLDTL